MRYLTAGESHGPSLTAIVEGMPAGVRLGARFLDAELARRQVGYGRGARMAIEKDRVRITSGVRHGRTIGSPIALTIENKDWENWKDVMALTGRAGKGGKVVTRPRPGHADLSGAMKYAAADIRDILERSSARETAARVAVGAVAKVLLKELGIEVLSWVTSIGGASCKAPSPVTNASLKLLAEAYGRAEESDFRCPVKRAEGAMKRAIDGAKKSGNSLGGVFEVVATGLPPGLGSHVQWDRKLDARLAGALMSVQAIKGVEVGLGFGAAALPGSKVHDEIFYRRGAFKRDTNNAGGFEGGMTNGEPIVMRAAMKPIPTLYKPLRSVDMKTKRPFKASIERSDICAVPAASVVAEAAVAFEVAAAAVEKFGGDSIKEMKRNMRGYLRQVASI